MTLVVVSAHLDDAVFSVYGRLSPAATVVTVLAGEPPEDMLGAWDRETGATDSRVRVQERRNEDRDALELCGAAIQHLDFLDEQYVEAGAAAPDRNDLVAALDDLRHPSVTVLAPAGIHNTDHKRVRDAVLEVRPDATLYADLPYALRDGFELPDDLPARSRRREEVRLDDDQLAAKLASARCYRSQIGQLAVSFGDFLARDAMRREVLWL
jgi:LmbE family N-acetylglucosaminyl deacetylase